MVNTERKADIFDPEEKLAKLHYEIQNPFRWGESIMAEDIRHKRHELRNKIGLPVARGKDPHVKDKFYKFLVWRVVKEDSFGIFNEYDRAVGEIPEELDLKINRVADLVHELLECNLNWRGKCQKYHEFAKMYSQMQSE